MHASFGLYFSFSFCIGLRGKKEKKQDQTLLQNVFQSKNTTTKEIRSSDQIGLNTAKKEEQKKRNKRNANQTNRCEKAEHIACWQSITNIGI